MPAKAATNSVKEKFLLKTAPDEAATNSTLAKAGTNFTLAKAVTNSASARTGTNSAPDKTEKKTGSKKPTRKRPLRIGEDRELNLTSIQELWGVDFAIVNLPPGSNDTYQAVRVTNQTDLPLPYTLDWHSGIVCSNLNAAWHKIYLRGTNPVVVERRFGHGSVVIATDSYFLSNEAMQKDRHADVLAWLVGSGSNVVFDEAHLGVMESSGVAMLMRKYRLHWLAGGLVLLAGLFIWKNSVSLVPAARRRRIGGIHCRQRRRGRFREPAPPQHSRPRPARHLFRRMEQSRGADRKIFHRAIAAGRSRLPRRKIRRLPRPEPGSGIPKYRQYPESATRRTRAVETNT